LEKVCNKLNGGIKNHQCVYIIDLRFFSLCAGEKNQSKTEKSLKEKRREQFCKSYLQQSMAFRKTYKV